MKKTHLIIVNIILLLWYFLSIYVNVIAVKEGNENNEAIKALVDVLKSDDVKNYIKETYDGAVLPYEE